MQKVFLSFHFCDEDRSLARAVRDLLESHGLVPITGEYLGGKMVMPAVMQRIEECDSLIALLTRREQMTSGKWTTHDWARDELHHARELGVRTIALVEIGVELGGVHATHHSIPLDRNKPLDAILALSRTIGQWKQEAEQKLRQRTISEDAAGTYIPVKPQNNQDQVLESLFNEIQKQDTDATLKAIATVIAESPNTFEIDIVAILIILQRRTQQWIRWVLDDYKYIHLVRGGLLTIAITAVAIDKVEQGEKFFAEYKNLLSVCPQSEVVEKIIEAIDVYGEAVLKNRAVRRGLELYGS